MDWDKILSSLEGYAQMVGFFHNNAQLLATLPQLIQEFAQELAGTEAKTRCYRDAQGIVFHIHLDTSHNIANLLWKMQFKYGHLLRQVQLKGIRIIVETKTNQYLLQETKKVHERK